MRRAAPLSLGVVQSAVGAPSRTLENIVPVSSFSSSALPVVVATESKADDNAMREEQSVEQATVASTGAYKNYGKRTPLMFAIEQGVSGERGPETLALKYLEEHKALDVNEADIWGNTALHYACVWGFELVAAQLLALKADPRCKTHDMGEHHGLQTPLQLAAKYGGTSGVLKALLEAPKLLYWTKEQNWEPKETRDALLTASRNGHIPEVLLDTVAFEQDDLIAALCCAVQRGHTEAALTLVTHGTRLETRIDHGIRALIEEARERPPESNEEFHARTVGEAMLLTALRNDLDDIANFLASNGADPGLIEISALTSHNGAPSIDHPFGVAIDRGSLQEAISMLPAGFMTAPAAALYAGLSISEAAQKAAKKLRVTDPAGARRLKKRSIEAELMSLAMLQTLPEDRAHDLLRSKEGEMFLRKAAKLESVVILSQPVVQQDLVERWFGSMLGSLKSGIGTNAWGDRIPMQIGARFKLAMLFLFIALPLNLLSIPAIAIFPPLESSVISYLSSLGGNGERFGILRKAGHSDGIMMSVHCIRYQTHGACPSSPLTDRAGLHLVFSTAAGGRTHGSLVFHASRLSYTTQAT